MKQVALRCALFNLNLNLELRVSALSAKGLQSVASGARLAMTLVAFHRRTKCCERGAARNNCLD